MPGDEGEVGDGRPEESSEQRESTPAVALVRVRRVLPLAPTAVRVRRSLAKSRCGLEADGPHHGAVGDQHEPHVAVRRAECAEHAERAKFAGAPSHDREASDTATRPMKSSPRVARASTTIARALVPGVARSSCRLDMIRDAHSVGRSGKRRCPLPVRHRTAPSDLRSARRPDLAGHQRELVEQVPAGPRPSRRRAGPGPPSSVQVPSRPTRLNVISATWLVTATLAAPGSGIVRPPGRSIGPPVGAIGVLRAQVHRGDRLSLALSTFAWFSITSIAPKRLPDGREARGQVRIGAGQGDEVAGAVPELRLRQPPGRGVGGDRRPRRSSPRPPR